MKFDKSKQTVAVIFGGVSVEHDISIITGVQTLNALNKNKYNVVPIYISKDNVWYTGEQLFDIRYFAKNSFKNELRKVFLMGKQLCTFNFNFKKVVCTLSFVYLALHGGMGENGNIQGYLDINGLPYSSCGNVGSGICMDKYLTKLLCKSQNIEVVNGVLLKEQDKTLEFSEIIKKLKNLQFPLIVKPNKLGSSIGVNFCKTNEQLKNAISFAFMFDTEVLIEQAIENLQEFNIAVMGNSQDCELSDIEKVNKTNDFLTFENKYMSSNTSGKGMEGADREVPAKIEKEISDKICDYAIKIYKLLNLKGIVRIDFLYDDDSNKIYLNEVNTIPGSLSNYLWKTKKYNFNNILEKLKQYALYQFEVDNKKVKNFSSSVLSTFKDGTKLSINK